MKTGTRWRRATLRPAGAPARSAGWRHGTGGGSALALAPSVLAPGLRASGSEQEHPRRLDQALARELAQSDLTWHALARLGVRDGELLPLGFSFRSAGSDADSELAAFLSTEYGYRVRVGPDGLTGSTPPLPVARSSLSAWARGMVLAGEAHGGCPFEGWTATLTVSPHEPARSSS